jgi:hypothetical protein
MSYYSIPPMSPVYYTVVYAGHRIYTDFASDFISDSNEPLHIQIGQEMAEI